MEADLRPLSTAQVLDRTFHIYRGHFPLLAGIGVLLPAMLLVLRLGFIPLGYPPRISVERDPFLYWSAVLEYSSSWLLVYVIAHAITGAATVYAVSRLNLGEAVTIAESYRKTLPRFWTVLRIAINIYLRVIGSGLATYVASLLVLVGGAALAALAGLRSSIFSAVVVFIFGIATLFSGVLWMLYLYAKYCLAIPACIVESLPARQSLRRARFLAAAGIRRISLIYLLMAVLGLGLSTAFWLPSQIYEEFFPRSFLTTVLLRIAGSFLAGVLAGPIGTIAIALVYYDHRIRKEAFDLQVMMDSLRQPPPEQPAPAVTGMV
jgi:hypothetical protein